MVPPVHDSIHERSNLIVAALGPTNTGKTHNAVERMLEHQTGMIGLPLRLLAREVYDRVTALVGEQSVALVTGEERRVPRRPRFWVCTTEAMPMDKDVDFVAVDEIQLAEHPQRGHVFTDRLLHARGVRETWLMGSDTMRDRIQELVPTANVQRRPRLSRLTGIGRLSLNALPPRSAVVAFSATQVYELAERIQRKRGGTAVVLGALSPRTRNAQVAMYQAGEVQYMVATDAIGMGLNMNVDLVAFAALRKFDGQRERMLEPAELAQIAGRAGRHMNDGSFATLAPLPSLPPPIVFALENHAFPSVRRLFWRNSDLDLSTLDGLHASLRKRPRKACLRMADRAEDHAALMELSSREGVRRRAITPERVALLWAVCQIPDFRQLLLDSHLRLLEDLYLQLSGPQGVVDTDWMARRIERLDDVHGDIETLMTKISFVRTWTYVANHGNWVSDPPHWQQRTREIEDRLSDALHERLVQRFVSQGHQQVGWRSSGRARRPRALEELDTKARVEGPFSALAGMKVRSGGPTNEPAIQTFDGWVDALVDAEHEEFSVDQLGRIVHDGEVVGRLTKGAELLRPEAVLAVQDELGAGARLRLQRRLSAFVRDWVDETLVPLRSVPLGSLSPAARGLVYQLEQRLGTVRMEQAREQASELSADDRGQLKRAGIVVGTEVIFVRPMLTPEAVRRRAVLCSAYLSVRWAPLPDGKATWCAVDPTLDPSAYTAIGYPIIGDRGVRADMVERLRGVLARASSSGAFEMPERVCAWLGLAAGEAVVGAPIWQELGYRRSGGPASGRVHWDRVNRSRGPRSRGKRKSGRQDARQDQSSTPEQRHKRESSRR